jgi:hypothetical protein
MTSPSISLANSRGVLRFSVLAWAAWCPDRQTRQAWRDWAGAADDAGADEPPPALPMMLRRRLSPFGQRLVGVTSTCAEGIGPARYVLSTRHGEMARALTTLAAIETDGLPSPTDFSMSIHHALLGLLSIHTGNRLGHTALSASGDTFASGLLEAASCVAERPGEPVILVHADEPLPQDYARFGEDDTAFPLVVALALGRPGEVAANDVTLELDADSPDAAPTANMATDFLRFLLSGASAQRAVGRRTQWKWRRAA